MKTKLLVLFLLILPFLFLNRKVSAQRRVENTNPQLEVVSGKKMDKKAAILALYLAKYNSPLQYHAQDFIDASEVFGLDWKMIPAIAGVESTFGKRIPGGYNAWGWGVYGTQAIYFDSWKEGIFAIAKGLRESYLNKGLTDPYSINRRYAASPFWGGKVSYFMRDLENFASKFEVKINKTVKVNATPNIAAISGQLALR